MPTLILRPSGIEEKYDKPWSLQLRYHNSVGPTQYHTLCHVNDETAQQIVEAKGATWLFGKPDWSERDKARALERARALKEEARVIEKRHR